MTNNRSKTSRSNFDSNTHLYIPLLKIQEGNVNYYYLTTFEVFPGYTRDILKNNFKNATSVRRGVARYDVIPNIYIGGQEISTKDMSTILQILSLEKQNNKSSKKLSQQEIVNKILNIIRREAENEIH